MPDLKSLTITDVAPLLTSFLTDVEAARSHRCSFQLANRERDGRWEWWALFILPNDGKDTGWVVADESHVAIRKAWEKTAAMLHESGHWRWQDPTAEIRQETAS